MTAAARAAEAGVRVAEVEETLLRDGLLVFLDLVVGVHFCFCVFCLFGTFKGLIMDNCSFECL